MTTLLVLGLLLTPPAPASAATLATVSVATNAPGAVIPVNFPGLSMEYGHIANFFGTPGAPNNAFLQMVKNIGTGVLRIGGNSQDQYCWDAVSGCAHTITAANVAALFYASAQTGFPLIMGVNLNNYSASTALDYANALISNGLSAYPGSRLLGMEVGNESDL